MKKLEKVEMLEQGEAYAKIIQWFFAYPLLPISLSDLSRELKISKKTATGIISELVEIGFIIKEEIGRSWRLSCNQKHTYNFTKKISYNLSLIYQFLYETDMISKIYEIIGNPKAIVLFGSYRKGDDTDNSDIDLAVEIVGNEDIKIVQLGAIPQIGYRKNVLVNLHIFSRNKIDLNLFNNIANGIVLEGFLEASP
ncbi:MAG: nucleotidyltransferase domain-containing protein [Nanoarchaeota archaeon]